MDPSVTHPLQSLSAFGQRHRTSIIAGAIALLTGFTLTAVAVAPLVPDAADLPQRLLTETVEPADLGEQLTALAAQPLTLLRNEVTRSTDTVDSLLARLGVSDAEAARFLRTDRSARALVSGRGGKMVQAQISPEGRLEALVVRFPAERSDQTQTHFTRMTLRPQDGQWQSRLESAPYGSRPRLASGVIHSSLFAATDALGLSDRVAIQMAEIFSVDLDFHRQLRRGDTFSVVYESLTADGEPVAWSEGIGRVLAAEFVNEGRRHQAVWFTGPDGRGAYYAPDGSSRKREFLASPMEFSRVTSGFAMRMHPILQRVRAHKGVDYSAPIGTPVRTVGDGIVDFAGRQNGYGKTIKIRHSQDRTTLYAHLSRIDVRLGQRVEQGQTVGAVGMTGITTGPHLHFEFLVRGEHQDPLRIARAAEPIPLDPAARPQFDAVTRVVQAKLSVAETLIGQRQLND